MRLALFLLSATLAFGQSNRTVTLTIGASPTAGVTGYNVYRAPTACNVSTLFAKITPTPITGLTLDDPRPIGTYCYYATAIGVGLESAPSVKVEAVVTPAAPSSLSITVQVAVTVNVNGRQVAHKDFTGQDFYGAVLAEQPSTQQPIEDKWFGFRMEMPKQWPTATVRAR